MAPARGPAPVTAVLTAQLALTCGLSLPAWWWAGWPAVAAVWFGGLIAAINLAQLARRLRPSARGPGPAQLMAGAAERFLFTLTAFGIAIATLHLAPLPLLAGFAGAQFGYLIGPLDREHAS